MTIISYYCGQESFRRNGVALIVNKRVQNAVLGSGLKNDRIILFYFQSKPFNITLIQVYAPTTDAQEAEVDQFYEDLEELLELWPYHSLFLASGSRRSESLSGWSFLLLGASGT